MSHWPRAGHEHEWYCTACKARGVKTRMVEVDGFTAAEALGCPLCRQVVASSDDVRRRILEAKFASGKVS